MKKYYLRFLVIAFALFGSSCLSSTYFAIVNSSNSELAVHYEMKPSGTAPHEGIRKPSILSIEEFRSGKFQWRELPPDRFTIDVEKAIVKALIEPNEVLQVEDEDSIDVDEEPSEQQFDIKKFRTAWRKW